MLLSVADICNIQTQISSGKGEIITFLVFLKKFFFTIISLRARCYTSYFSIYKFSAGEKIGYLDNRGYLAMSEDIFGCHNLGRRDCCWHLVVKVAQLCWTVFYPMNYTVHGILQARILEWVAFPFSRGSSQTRDQTQVSCIAGGIFTS